MKKLCTTLVTVFAIAHFSYAQNTYPWPTSGNIGIGTTSPAENLSITAASNSTNQIGFGVTGEGKSALYHLDAVGLYIYAAIMGGANQSTSVLAEAQPNKLMIITRSGWLLTSRRYQAHKITIFTIRRSYRMN